MYFLGMSRNKLQEEGCSKEDIEIIQGEVSSQPSGIPSYRVEITNTGKQAIQNIILNCGMFSSASLSTLYFPEGFQTRFALSTMAILWL